MDRFPLVPENEDNHDILPVITEAFQNTFRSSKYPINIAENIKKYRLNDENKTMENTALSVLKIKQEQETISNDIREIEEELISIHAQAIMTKDQLLNERCSKVLKRREIFQKLSDHAIYTYGLIQKLDIFPNKIEQYLDFTYNPSLHTCKEPCPPINKLEDEQTVIRTKRRSHKIIERDAESQPVLQLQPDKIIFKNYELGKTYKKRFKLFNISKNPQSFHYCEFPKDFPFQVIMLSESCRLFAGMCADFLVIFKPVVYKNEVVTLNFKNVSANLELLLCCTRDPPKLVCYVYNPLLPFNSVEKLGPDSESFSNRRRSALNFTIDCGTCLLGKYQLAAVLMKNVGPKGKFFITTENEWFFNEMNDHTTRSRELTQGCFSIFPIYFEIDRDEVGEIFIIFFPEHEGVFTERFFILCDNNTHQEIELLGDCICFSSNYLKVNLYLLENTFNYTRRFVTTTLASEESSGFIFSVVNNSPVYFDYYWALKTSKEEYKHKRRMDPDWIQIFNTTKYLPSYSTTDVIVQLTPKTEEDGAFYIYICLYIQNIPIESLVECQFFTIRPDQDKLAHRSCRNCALSSITLAKEEMCKDELFNTLYKFADVHICELEIFCIVPKMEASVDEAIEEETQQDAMDLSIHSTTAGKTSKPPSHPRLKLSKTVLSFGTIPKGVEVSKCFVIENLTNQELVWKIVEIRCSSNVQLEISPENVHLNHSSGTVKKKRRIGYTVAAQGCIRWVSILALYSSPSCTCKFSLESICLVVYTVEEIKISIQTDNFLPVLCPKELIYVGIPTFHTIYVINSGALIGCFYFLKPKGDESNKISVRFHPQSGIVHPGGTVEVKVELMVLENGVFDDVYVPCFNGDIERLISLRIVCTVASISVNFFLPSQGKGYNKVLWPPRLDSQFDWNVPVVGEAGDDRDGGEDSVMVVPSVSELDMSLQILIAADSVASTYPTVKVKPVRVKKPAKITFYIENLTPVNGNFEVDATNYGPEHECLNHILVKAKTRPPEFFWEQACLNGYGIVIEPEHSSGNMVGHEVVEITLWIYANTWGKYLEEVIVDINDLTPFCFNLIVEVVGLPVEFPFARNTLLEYPTIRFENLSYTSEENEKSFTITNISAVPLHMSWHIFIPDDEPNPFNVIIEIYEDTVSLTLTPEYFGSGACPGCIELKPFDYILEKDSTLKMSVVLNACTYRPLSKERTYLTYNLVGFIHLSDEFKFKENYFRRISGVDLKPAEVNVLVTLEPPIMEVDVASDETNIDIFVNDIFFNLVKDPEIYMLFRNVDVTSIYFEIETEKPFQIIEARTIPTGIRNIKELILHRHECLQVLIKCHFALEDLLQFAEFIYKDCGEQRKIITEFTSIVRKNLYVHQKGVARQMIPLEVRLHYPHIEVKPSFIKFGHGFLYNTKKSVLSIYNLTGAPVRFEIYKSCKRDNFEINPSYGEIPRSTGANKQFVDIVIYFTPRECEIYIESLRIVTNIPQYYIDVPLTGHGSNNEKFYVE